MCACTSLDSWNTRFQRFRKIRMMLLIWNAKILCYLSTFQSNSNAILVTRTCIFFNAKYKWWGGVPAYLFACLYALTLLKSLHHLECVHFRNFTHSTFDMYYVIWYPHLASNIFFPFYFCAYSSKLTCQVYFFLCTAIKWDEEIRTPDINYDDEKDTK